MCGSIFARAGLAVSSLPFAILFCHTVRARVTLTSEKKDRCDSAFHRSSRPVLSKRVAPDSKMSASACCAYCSFHLLVMQVLVFLCVSDVLGFKLPSRCLNTLLTSSQGTFLRSVLSPKLDFVLHVKKRTSFLWPSWSIYFTHHYCLAWLQQCCEPFALCPANNWPVCGVHVSTWSILICYAAQYSVYW